MNTEHLENALRDLQAQAMELDAVAKRVGKRARSVMQEINAIPGKRLVHTLNGEISFTASQDGQKGAPVTILVSKDGPFVLTHYPIISWRPSLPTTATNLGRWSAIRSYSLPVQQVGTDVDMIDISYEMVDAGSQGALQNLVVSGQLLSASNNVMPLGIPIMFASSATIQIVPTYNNVSFAAPAVPTTAGILHVDLLGFRIVNN